MFMIDRHRIEYAVLPTLLKFLYLYCDSNSQKRSENDSVMESINNLVEITLSGLKDKHRMKLERRLQKIESKVERFCEGLPDREIGFLTLILLVKHLHQTGKLHIKEYPEYEESFKDVDWAIDNCVKKVEMFNSKWNMAMSQAIEFLIDLNREGYFC